MICDEDVEDMPPFPAYVVGQKGQHVSVSVRANGACNRQEGFMPSVKGKATAQ